MTLVPPPPVRGFFADHLHDFSALPTEFGFELSISRKTSQDVHHLNPDWARMVRLGSVRLTLAPPLANFALYALWCQRQIELAGTSAARQYPVIETAIGGSGSSNKIRWQASRGASKDLRARQQATRQMRLPNGEHRKIRLERTEERPLIDHNSGLLDRPGRLMALPGGTPIVLTHGRIR